MKSNTDSSEFKDVITKYGFQQYINTPTRKHSCIDHILSNIENAQGSTYELCLSYHNTCQILTFPTQEQKPILKHYYILVRDYSRENVDKSKEVLSNLSWHEIYHETEADYAFTNFHDGVLLLYKLCFPLKNIKLFSNYCRPKWVTKGIRISSTNKRQLRLRFYFNKNCYALKHKYLEYNIFFFKCLDSSKRCYINIYLILKRKARRLGIL